MDFWSVVRGDKKLILLLILSVAIFPSLFMSTKILGIVLLAFTIVVFWNLFSIMGINVLSRLSENSWSEMNKAKSEGSYFKSGVYILVFPMVVIGFIAMAINLFALIFLM